jgi:hypothetical protein
MATVSLTTSWSRPRTDHLLIGLLAAACAGVYVAHTPAVPDLAAQVARVDAAKSGALLWWSGWFGGLQLPSYSVLSPFVMSVLGVSISAALAALAASLFGVSLFRHSLRPIASALALSVAAFADILAGRVTFALGAAAAVGATVLIKRDVRWAVVPASLVAYLFSPLAGLFLGLAALAIAVAQPALRRAAIYAAATLAVAAVVQMLMLPGAGEMPFPWWHMLIALTIVTAVGIVCPDRTIRTGCAIAAAAVLLFYFVPSPVGTNIVRLVWLLPVPTVLAAGKLPKTVLVPLVLALSVWPAIDLGIQLDKAGSTAAKPGFYGPLVTALHHQAATAGPQTQGERVEVVDPVTQWGAAYVAAAAPIARGWDRPTDRADNALFYDGSLTSTSYQEWLNNTAVGWVALPLHVPLDYASVKEAAIVRSQPSYLRPVWRNDSWQLYRVVNAQPLLQGASLVTATGSGVTFIASEPGEVSVTVRWSPYLRLTANNQIVDTCIINAKPWTQVLVPSAGTYTLTARFDPDFAGRSTACQAS